MVRVAVFMAFWLPFIAFGSRSFVPRGLQSPRHYPEREMRAQRISLRGHKHAAQLKKHAGTRDPRASRLNFEPWKKQCACVSERFESSQRKDSYQKHRACFWSYGNEPVLF
jgi:hypothetical protein